VLGYSWEETVVWHGMPVRSADGGYVGTLFEAIFDAETGQVARIRLSTGLVGDAAVGKLEVDGALVRGFDGAAIIVMPGFADIAASGGAAKRAAGTAAVARVQGSDSRSRPCARGGRGGRSEPFSGTRHRPQGARQAQDAHG